MVCCGKEMRHTQLGYYTCDLCGEQYNDALGIIKEALDSHPGANAIELMKYTGLPSKIILNYMRNGTLSSVTKEKNMKGYYIGNSNKAQWHIDVRRHKDT